jgi:hypothetical protein
MRTTVSLEQDLADVVKDYARRRHISFRVALDTLLRRGLATQETAPSLRRRFPVEVHSSGFRRGVDPDRLNQIVDRLEAGDFVREMRVER